MTFYYFNTFFLNSSFENIDTVLGDLLGLGFAIYLFGIFGIMCNNNNFLISMICAELMYLGITFNFILIGSVGNFYANIFALLILVMAACESAIGLGVLIVLYRFNKNLSFNSYVELANTNYLK